MKELAKNTIFAIIGTGVLFVGADFALTGSDVYVSYTTGECVKVENYDGVFFSAGNYNCELLPEKYTHIWAK